MDNWSRFFTITNPILTDGKRLDNTTPFERRKGQVLGFVILVVLFAIIAGVVHLIDLQYRASRPDGEWIRPPISSEYSGDVAPQIAVLELHDGN